MQRVGIQVQCRTEGCGGSTAQNSGAVGWKERSRDLSILAPCYEMRSPRDRFEMTLESSISGNAMSPQKGEFGRRVMSGALPTVLGLHGEGANDVKDVKFTYLLSSVLF